MDRFPRTLAACGLGVLMAAAGCRSTRPEVPPGRPFANDGRQRKAIEFSSEGHPVRADAAVGYPPTGGAGGVTSLANGIGTGASRPDPAAFGAPPGAYGGPGTSGLGQPPSLTPATSDPAAMPAAMPPPPSTSPTTNSPPAGLPPAPMLEVAPPSLSTPAPNQVIQGPPDTPGKMGRPDQMPSPN
jgi:hypothetical protein